MHEESERHGIKIDKWQIKIITAPNRPNIPKQMIKLEIACVASYSANAKALKNNYEFLPDGYSDTLVLVESLDEIMADKLIAFPTSRQNIRYRDIWDLQWLQKQGATINIDFVKKKIDDYKITNYINNLENIIQNISRIIRSDNFKSQMSRFIPLSIQERTLKKEKFYIFLENEIGDMFKKVLNSL